MEVFYHNQRVASHVRVFNTAALVYVPEHMPEVRRHYWLFLIVLGHELLTRAINPEKAIKQENV